MIVGGLDAAERNHGLVILDSDLEGGEPNVLHELRLTVPDMGSPEELQWWRDTVCEIFEPYPDCPIAIEGPAYGRTERAHSQGKYRGVIELALWECGHPLLDVSVGSLKKFVTGKGSGKKEKMALGCYKKWRYECDDNNIIDAYALARFMEMYESDWDLLPAYKRELIRTVDYYDVAA